MAIGHKFINCLPRSVSALGISSVVKLHKMVGQNAFKFNFRGEDLTYHYNNHKEFAFFYNAIQNEQTREKVPVSLFDLPSNIDAALDLGAHFGLYTVLLGVLNPDKRIYAFEPIPSNLQALYRNININQIEVEVVEAAVNQTGDSVNMKGGGTSHGVRFYESTVDAHIIDSEQKEPTKGLAADGIKISEFLSNKGIRNPFLKIDIEGEEYGVIKDLLNNSEVDSISGFLEIHPGMCRGGKSHEILYWLEQNDISFELVKDHNPNRPGYYFTSLNESV